MSTARPRTARSGDEPSNHKATAPPTILRQKTTKMLCFEEIFADRSAVICSQYNQLKVEFVSLK